MGWRKICERNGIIFAELTSELPCCRWLNSTTLCGRMTRYALVVPHADHDTIFACCDEHIPDWVGDWHDEGRTDSKVN